MDGKVENKGRWVQGEHVVSSSLCTPGVRMVVLHVWHDDETSPPSFGRHIEPVVALESVIVEEYSKHTYSKEAGLYPLESTRRDLEDKGYQFNGRKLLHRIVCMTRDMGLMASEDGNPMGCGGGNTEVVVCPWPVEEDGVRLEPIFKDIEERVKRIEELKASAAKEGAKG